MPGSVERVKGVERRQHWMVVVFWGVVTRAGAVRYVVVVFEDCARIGGRSVRKRRNIVNVRLVKV
jgi:hypothetical protein